MHPRRFFAPWIMGTIAIVACVATPHAARAEFILDAELLVNGDAETGDTAGWLSNGIETGPRSLAGTLGLPPGVDIGEFSFWAGEGPELQTMTQTVDVTAGAALIDSGMVRSNFSILLQSRSMMSVDVARAELSFLNEQGVSITSLMFEDRQVAENVPDWDLIESQQLLPSGTRSIALVFESERLSGGFSSDGFFDNASLRLTAVPEPSTVGLLVSALIVVLFPKLRRWRLARF